FRRRNPIKHNNLLILHWAVGWAPSKAVLRDQSGLTSSSLSIRRKSPSSCHSRRPPRTRFTILASHRSSTQKSIPPNPFLSNFILNSPRRRQTRFGPSTAPFH